MIKNILKLYSMEKIEKDEFSDCVNIKSKPKFIEYFNKKILLFFEKLESIRIPDYYEIMENFLFRNYRSLNKINYLSGKKKIFYFLTLKNRKQIIIFFGQMLIN